MKLISTTSFEARMAQLEVIKDHISLKFYYSIREKLEKERKVWEDLLTTTQNRKRSLAEYSFVLDQQYFEQKFLP